MSSSNLPSASPALVARTKDQSTNSPAPRSRSRGQLARRHSTTSAARLGLSHAHHHTSRPKNASAEPLIGGLYFSDIIVIAFNYALNCLRTLPLAELGDICITGLFYIFTALPLELYQRWSLSTYHSTPTALDSKRAAAAASSHRGASALDSSDDDGDLHDMSPVPVHQLSPFHHIVILLTRFAAANFPHLVPRVLFAEDTIGSFVFWRTGGGAASLVNELRGAPLPAKKTPDSTAAESSSQKEEPAPSFRAFWIGTDAHVPLETRSTNTAAQNANTMLYLHGGGFSLGSVAFYAEALLRILDKVWMLESQGRVDVQARCVAVEYDLSPAARFPGPLLQCLRCYAHLIEVENIDPECITIAGDSAGGNLAMALLLALNGQAADEPRLGERDWTELPMPGKAVLISPWVDLRPSRAHAFAPLRTQVQQQSAKPEPTSTSHTAIKVVKEQDSKNDSSRATAVAAFEWDYVAAETLLHFAQLYTGVLPHPRRVRGPMGWIADICETVADGFPRGGKFPIFADVDSKAKAAAGDAAKKGSGDSTPIARSSLFDAPRALAALAAPPRRLARATHEALTEPLFAPRSSIQEKGTEMKVEVTTSDNAQVSLLGMYLPPKALEPLFSTEERRTDLVTSRAELYVPFDLDPSDEVERPGLNAAVDGARLLDTHPLVNPVLGDWGEITLKHGMLVLWGEREGMAPDIEEWVQSVHEAAADHLSCDGTTNPRSRSGNDSSISDNSMDLPAQDGEHSPPTRPSCASLPARADWLHSAVERGPAGVHAWPFVSMYLSNSNTQREKGLDLVARFVAKRPSGPELRLAPRQHRRSGSEGDESFDRYAHTPPHAAPLSPPLDTDGGSIEFALSPTSSQSTSHGSMPSDLEYDYGRTSNDLGLANVPELRESSGSFSRAQSVAADFPGVHLGPGVTPSATAVVTHDPQTVDSSSSSVSGGDTSISSSGGGDWTLDADEVEDDRATMSTPRAVTLPIFLTPATGPQLDFAADIPEPSYPGIANVSARQQSTQMMYQELHARQAQEQSRMWEQEQAAQEQRVRSLREQQARNLGRLDSSRSVEQRGRPLTTSQPLWWTSQPSPTANEQSGPQLTIMTEPAALPQPSAVSFSSAVPAGTYLEVRDVLDDIEEVSEGTTSPSWPSPGPDSPEMAHAAMTHQPTSLSLGDAAVAMGLPPSESSQGSTSQALPIPFSPASFGMSYMPRAQDGLSDILEEGSVLSGSTPASPPSRWEGSMSPPFTRDGTNAVGPQADWLREALREREREWRTRPSSALQLTATGGGGEGFGDEGEDDEDGEDELESGEQDLESSALSYEEEADEDAIPSEMAFSPPAPSQPGPAIPLTRAAAAAVQQSARRSSSDLSLRKSSAAAAAEGADPDGTKKPKGDVWW